MEEIRTLKKIELFCECTENEPLKIKSLLLPAQTYPKGHVLMEPQSQENDVFFVVSGNVRLSLIDENGELISYRDIKCGDYFGWLSAIDHQVRLTSAVATEKTTVIKATSQNFKKIIKVSNSIEDKFLSRLCGVIRDYTNRIKSLTTLSSKDRVLRELKKRFEEDNGKLIISSHEDFATWAGTSRETVSRVFSNLDKKGTIKRNSNEYELLKSIDLSSDYLSQ